MVASKKLGDPNIDPQIVQSLLADSLQRRDVNSPRTQNARVEGPKMPKLSLQEAGCSKTRQKSEPDEVQHYATKPLSHEFGP